MLWYKGWLETRIRVAFLFGFICLIVGMQNWARHGASGVPNKAAVLSSIYTLVPMQILITAAILGAAGIATQPSFAASKGLHGSTLYTLSLPVKRTRLVLTRAAIGWVEMALALTVFVCVIWYRSSALRMVSTSAAWGHFALAVLICGSTFYFTAVLLGSFLDDQWRTWGTMMLAGFMVWASVHHWLPAAVDIIAAVTRSSPLVGNAMPWGPMAFSVALSAVLFAATLVISERREY